MVPAAADNRDFPRQAIIKLLRDAKLTRWIRNLAFASFVSLAVGQGLWLVHTDERWAYLP